MKPIQYALVIAGVLATGLPQLTHAMPAAASPYLLGVASILSLTTAVLGALSEKFGGGQ